MKMKKQLLIILGICAGSFSLLAQEFKLAKSTGTLEIKEVNEVKIEGYAGKELIFTSRDFDRENDDRAKGLRAISSLGLEDNTGLGLSVIDNNGVIEVRQLKKMDGPDIIIKVPQGMAIKYSHSSPHGSDVEIKNLSSEVDVSTVHNDVRLENLTGALKIRTVHGDIDAKFTGEIKNPVSLSSTHGHVDAAMPTGVAANLKLNTSWGEIFVDPGFKLEFDKSGDMVKYSDKLTAKLNGGGIEISLSSTHDNVYLRKNK